MYDFIMLAINKPSIKLLLYGIVIVLGTVILLFISPFTDTINGFWAIQIHPSLLVSDYLGVGGLTATLLNVWLTTWLSILVLHFAKVRLSGASIAGVLTIAGFAFYGKNLWNFLPVWMGFYLFSKIRKEPISKHVAMFLFSSGIAPLSSFIAFGIPGLPLWASLPLGISASLLAGFITPMVASITTKFHQGYNLYSTGFALGFIAMLFAGILRAFDVSLSVNDTTTFAYHDYLYWSIFALSLLSIAFAFIVDRRAFSSWIRLLRSSGRLPSDYVEEYGLGAALLNIGSLGLFSIALVGLFQYRLSGPMVAAIFTLIAFGGFGKHIANSLPLMAGLLLATLLPGNSHHDLGTSTALFFVTALAPIAGKFGLLYGLLAGFLHLLVAPYALTLQGGFDLYNNGFTAGLIAGVIAVIAQHLPLRLWFVPDER
ncbi:MAG: DUF1576 domain-containing protein [Methanomicrobia archaeon]|nr:DUF1576 domain-containing protein [Methanomicrobia archaeon]